MKRTINLDAILAPVPGDNPAGENLRYSPVYDEINEARRADDPFSLGEWKHEVKTSDWDKALTLAVDALTNKSKDLQITAWLTEALIMTEGFAGLSIGIKLVLGLLTDYWENVYPLIEDEDLEFRAAPFEFMNEKLSTGIKQIPLTDKNTTSAYSLLKWNEARKVGYEADIRNQYGDVDDKKKEKRNELLADGRLSAEEFDQAITLSSTAFYKSLAESMTTCLEDFKKLDETVDQKFGPNAPRLAEFRESIEECSRVVMKIYKEKIEQEPVPEPNPEEGESMAPSTEELQEAEEAMGTEKISVSTIPSATKELSEEGLSEKALWQEAFQIMKTSGIKQALDRLLAVSYSAPSIRERNRYRLLIAKLCLKADRPDLAKPIIEELHALIEELHLDRWESPLWIAEVFDTLYQCLTKGNPSDDDLGRAMVLFKRLCSMDVTRAISYKR